MTFRNDERRGTKLAALCFAAFSIRLAFGIAKQNPWAAGGDSELYVHMANQFLGREAGQALTHPPVYPAFLAIFYGAFQHPVWWVLAAQSAFGVLSLGLTMLIARRLGTEKAVWAAAILVAIDPFQIALSGVFLSETLFTALLMAGLYTLMAAMSLERTRDVLASALLLSLAALTRSILGPFLPLFTLALFCLSRGTFARKCKITALFFAGLAIPMAAWSGVVHAKTGHWVAISSQKGWNIYEGLNPDFDNAQAILAWQQGMGAESERLGLSDPVQRDAYFFEKVKQTVRAHPAATARLMMRKFFKFWRLWPYFPYSKTQRIISLVFMLPVLLFALYGAFAPRQIPEPVRSAHFVLLGFILLYSLTNTITWTQIRYRVPIHPLLAVFAGLGIQRFFFNRQRASHG